MPYVPSEKTTPPAEDRKILDATVEVLSRESAGKITNNLSLITVYKSVFYDIAKGLQNLVSGRRSDCAQTTACHIYEVGEKYGYEGAYLGELNYTITRFIQRVPQIMVESGTWKDELRYWLYAATVEALTHAAYETRNLSIGVSGVFEDIKDEYKRRVNVAYEAAQILKSGDCYDTPYYTRLVEVVDEDGNHVGHQEVMLKRSEATLRQDVLDGQFVLRRRK
jgi:hypothetical protein